MIYTGSKTLQYLSVAMFTVFKNLTIIIVALGEERLFASRITRWMWLSFVLMVAGSVVGGFNDLSFSGCGYFWMVLNSGSNAAYLLYMKSVIKSVGFSDFDSVFYNNILSLPILTGLSLIFEDWTGFWRQLIYTNGIYTNLNLIGGILLSGLAGFFISFTTAWCLRVAPSTTYSMVGALNKLPVALSGLIFFPQERSTVNAGYLCSIGIAFVAGLIYSYAQLQKKNSEGVPGKPAASSKSDKKMSVIDILNEYESRLGIKATYHELAAPKIQHK